MAVVFTYDSTLPTARDWVRLLTGDTRDADAELDDFELDALLLDEPEPVAELPGEEPTVAQWRAYRYRVAAQAAELMASKHARDADVSFDNQRVSLSSKFAQYTATAKRLRAMAQTHVPIKVVRW
jgi:hypothetical protein